jgi:hypothetical protein
MKFTKAFSTISIAALPCTVSSFAPSINSRLCKTSFSYFSSPCISWAKGKKEDNEEKEEDQELDLNLEEMFDM